MDTPHVSRRQILTLAGLTLGAGVVELGGLAGPAAAATGDEPTLQPIADSPVSVLSAAGAAAAAVPRQLAVRVVRPADLPAGSRIAITFDPRVYSPLTSPIVTRDGRPVAATRTVDIDPKTGLRTSAITLTEAVPAGGDMIAIVGTAHPLLFPHDLLRRPAAPTARVRRGPHATDAQRSLQPGRPAAFGGAAQAWGTEVDVLWENRSWGDQDAYHYAVPVRVSLRGVGPGQGPSATAFTVALDRRLAGPVTVASAELNFKPYGKGLQVSGTRRTASQFRAGFSAPVRLGPGDVLDVYLRVAAVVPTGPVTGLAHPVVALAPAGQAASQRHTGKESVSRSDAVAAATADG
jgi:hypothetical protein